MPKRFVCEGPTQSSAKSGSWQEMRDFMEGWFGVSQSTWRCEDCWTPWPGRLLMASPVVGDRCDCGGVLEQIAGDGWPDDLIGRRVGDNRD